jgi:nucleotide-binding universal stress UspA family protein
MIASANTSRTLTHQAWEFEKGLPGGVVVGVDGSPESIAALNTGASIARSKRCVLHAVSVLPSISSLEASETHRIGLRASELSELLRALEAPADWSSEAVIGRPVRALTEIAERRGAELIVLGKRRHNAIDQLIGNETTLQVMRVTSVPVLAVEAEIDRPRMIVAAIDFSPSSLRAAKLSLQLLKAAGSGVLYLVFVELPTELIDNKFKRTDENRFPGDIVVWFRRFVESLGPHQGILAEPVILTGRAVTAVAEFAERVGADLIATASHSHGRFERFLLGSVSSGLVKDASCPVLVVPPCS